MSEILLDEEVGYVSVTCGTVETRLDLFAVNDQIADLHKEYAGKPATEYAAAIQDLIESLGLPRVSVYVAGQFVRQIVAACEELKKKADPSPDSLASTASTLSN